MTKLILLFLFFLTSITFAQKHTIRLEKLDDGVYVHTSFKNLNNSPFPSNGLVVVTDKSVVLIDTPWDEDQTAQLLTRIKKDIKKPVKHCIVTHSHDDRVSGTRMLRKKKVQIMSLALTAEKMMKDGYEKPDVILPEDSLFNINGVWVHTYFPGEGHTHDNLVVWLPHHRILFGGCFIKSPKSPDLGYIAEANLQAWPASVNRVKEKFENILIVVPGHQGWEGDDGIDHTLRLLNEKSE